MWVLIIIAIVSGPRIAIDHIEFADQKTCEHARDAITEHDDSFARHHDYTAQCLPTGRPQS